jgi:hypothetical protein
MTATVIYPAYTTSTYYTSQYGYHTDWQNTYSYPYYYNPPNGNPPYSNPPYYSNPYQSPYPVTVTQTSYVTQLVQAWQTQFLTQQQTQYYTAFLTATVNSFITQSTLDPLTIFGLIGAGVGITLAIVGVSWALLKRPHQ